MGGGQATLTGAEMWHPDTAEDVASVIGTFLLSQMGKGGIILNACRSLRMLTG